MLGSLEYSKQYVFTRDCVIFAPVLVKKRKSRLSPFEAGLIQFFLDHSGLLEHPPGVLFGAREMPQSTSESQLTPSVPSLSEFHSLGLASAAFIKLAAAKCKTTSFLKEFKTLN